MTMRRNWLLVGLFSALALMLSAVPGLGQVIFNYGGGSPQVREEGVTELVNKATLSVSAIGNAGGTIPANQGVVFRFTTSVTNALPLTTGGPGDSVDEVICSQDGTATCAITVKVTTTVVKNDTLTVSFTVATTFTTGGSIILQNLRVNASLLSAGAFVSATVAGTSSTSNTAFLQSSANVAQVAAVKSLVETLVTGPVSILTCNPLTQTANIDVAEAFSNALRVKADEGAGANTGDLITVSITNVPADVQVTPLTPIICGLPTSSAGCALALSTPASQTSTAAASTLTFTYTVLNESESVLEDAQLQFTFSTADATLPTLQASPSVASVILGPTTPSTDVPLFSGAAEPTAQPVAAFADCVTDLLLPYVTNFTGSGSAPDQFLNTGITISNTTLDTFPAAAGGALPQAGTCTLTLFPNNGIPGINFTTTSVPPGGQVGITMGNVPGWTGLTGYIIGTCNFQNAHSFISIYDNAGLGSPTFQQGYLGLILPNPSIVHRNPAGGGIGEGLKE